MKKIGFTSAFFVAFFIVAILSACSRDNEIPSPVQPSAGNLQFAMTFEDFGDDDTIQTRAVSQPMHHTVDLGNNIEADVYIAQDHTPVTPVTRSALQNGTYTVVAYKGTEVKGTLKGSWDGTTFTPDASSSNKMLLSEDTYTFVCFNGKITHNGTTLTINRTGDTGGAVLGVNRNVAVSGKKQTLKFEMKNMEARMRITLSTYRPMRDPIHSDITTTLASKTSTDIPTTAQYDLTTEMWGTKVAANISEADINNGLSTPDYHYFLPGTDATNLQLTFNIGKVYGRDMQGSIIKRLMKTSLPMQRNKSYNIRVALHYKFTYLFSDGTTGTIAANPGKTPVGLVVDKDSRTAVALKDASTSVLWTTRATGRQNQNLVNFYGGGYSGGKPYDGYNETWNAANSYDGITEKATSTDFPAFKAAAEYTPGVTTASTIGKWYLPAIGELEKYLQDTLTIGNTVKWQDTMGWAFTRAGGTSLIMASEMAWGYYQAYTIVPYSRETCKDSYLSSTEMSGFGDTTCCFIFERKRTYESMFPGQEWISEFCAPAEIEKNRAAYVRPFVHY